MLNKSKEQGKRGEQKEPLESMECQASKVGRKVPKLEHGNPSTLTNRIRMEKQLLKQKNNERLLQQAADSNILKKQETKQEQGDSITYLQMNNEKLFKLNFEFIDLLRKCQKDDRKKQKQFDRLDDVKKGVLKQQVQQKLSSLHRKKAKSYQNDSDYNKGIRIPGKIIKNILNNEMEKKEREQLHQEEIIAKNEYNRKMSQLCGNQVNRKNQYLRKKEDVDKHIRKGQQFKFIIPGFEDQIEEIGKKNIKQ